MGLDRSKNDLEEKRCGKALLPKSMGDASTDPINAPIIGIEAVGSGGVDNNVLEVSPCESRIC